MAQVDVEEDVLRCTVCLEDYRPYGPLKPRILPVCMHTFCESCLERLGADNGYSVPCPICRVFNDVFGKDGIQALPINTRVSYFEAIEEEMVEMDVIGFIDPSTPSCPMCDSITLYAPFGSEADITQCHTCQWVSVEVMEVEQVEMPTQPPEDVNNERTVIDGKKEKRGAIAIPASCPTRRKTWLRRALSYLR
ncbi:tripartite motif-containing protein 2-like [Mantella aurantiaca]